MKQIVLLLTGLGALPALGQAPVISTLTPARNAVSAPRAGSIGLGFTQPIDPATASGIRVYSQQTGSRRSGTISVNNSVVTFAPTTTLLAGETVLVSVPATVKATNGVAAVPQVFEFTAAVTGSLPPSFVPAATNTDFDTDAKGLTYLAVADIDGDGDLDVVSASPQNQAVRVRLNNGVNSGNFVAPATTPNASLGPNISGLTLGDVDGDGDADLAVANSNGTVSIRLNNGLPAVNFTVPVTNAEVAVGPGPSRVVLADVDGDGDLDLLTSNYGPNRDATGNTVSLRLNSGLNSGNFVAPATSAEIAVGTGPWTMALGDVDGDGDLDLLTANATASGGGNTVSVRLNTGVNSGVFAAPAANAEVTVGAGPRDITLGDVDGDGDLDLLTANPGNGTGNTVSLRLNNGVNSGNFGTSAANTDLAIWGATSGVKLGDLDGDGDLDMVTTNFGYGSSATIKLRLNRGVNSGIFDNPANEPAVSNAGSYLALADVDGDGDLDLITCSENGRMSLRVNKSVTLGATRPLATARLEVLPNPATGTAYVQVPDRATEVQVLDAVGRTVRVVPASASTKQTQLVLDGLRPGVYIVQTGEATARLLVE